MTLGELSEWVSVVRDEAELIEREINKKGR